MNLCIVLGMQSHFVYSNRHFNTTCQHWRQKYRKFFERFITLCNAVKVARAYLPMSSSKFDSVESITRATGDLTLAVKILQPRLRYFKSYYGNKQAFEVTSPRYFSVSACLNALRETEIKLTESEFARYHRRLDHVELNKTIKGEQSHDQFMPAFKIKFLGEIVYLNADKFCAESLRTIIQCPVTFAESNRGGKRTNSGRKRLVEDHPHAITIISDLIQLHSKSHDRRGDDVLKVGCSAGTIQAELAKHDITMCKQSIRYLMEPPRAGSRDAKRYNGLIKGRIQRSLVNDKQINSRSTPADIHQGIIE